jgi:hypothetical protein
MQDAYFVEKDSPHWDAAWEWLAAHPWNVTLNSPVEAECPETGEVWQYMATECDDGRWFDVFRHRHHPTMRRRVYLRRPVPSPA